MIAAKRQLLAGKSPQLRLSYFGLAKHWLGIYLQLRSFTPSSNAASTIARQQADIPSVIATQEATIARWTDAIPRYQDAAIILETSQSTLTTTAPHPPASATMAAKGPAAVGSSQWISNEKENVLDLLQQEKEELVYPAQHELEWLNEHMAEIFSRNQL